MLGNKERGLGLHYKMQNIDFCSVRIMVEGFMKTNWLWDTTLNKARLKREGGFLAGLL